MLLRLSLASMAIFIVFFCHAQTFKLENFGIGYRIMESNVAGTNPLSITPVLKDASSFTRFVDSFDFNGLTGNPSVQLSHTFYVSTEWRGDPSSSRFWRNHSISLGVFGTTNKAFSVGQLQQRIISSAPDQGFTDIGYSLTRNQQFYGLHTGLNRSVPLASRWQLLAGLHLQGGWSFVHFYQQRIDTTIVRQQGASTSTIWLKDDLQGKNYFQWLAMIPLLIEYQIPSSPLSVRAEINVSISGGPYLQGSYKQRLAAGGGLWLIYRRANTRDRIR